MSWIITKSILHKGFSLTADTRSQIQLDLAMWSLKAQIGICMMAFHQENPHALQKAPEGSGGAGVLWSICRTLGPLGTACWSAVSPEVHCLLQSTQEVSGAAPFS